MNRNKHKEIPARPSEFYDSHWSSYGDFIRFNPGARKRRQLIKRELLRIEGLSEIADFGAGSGDLIQFMHEVLPSNVRFVGADFSLKSLELIKERAPFAEVRLFDLAIDEPTESFQVVVCSEVLEHLDDPASAVRRLAQSTAKGGALIVTVPMGPVRPTQIAIGHVRHPRPKDVVNWFRDAGMECQISAKWGWPGYRFIHWLGNINPEAAVKNFGAAEYGSAQKAISSLTYFLARATSISKSRWGVQIVAIGKWASSE